jgi:alkyl hydroperoxide reductase subunit AhpC
MNYESTLDVGDEVPGFDLDSSVGKIFFREYIQGKWCMLVTFGSGFEPVATTDIGVLCRLSEELQSRNIFLLAIAKETSESLDLSDSDYFELFCLAANLRVWIKDIEEIQTVKVNFAIMSDTDCHVLKIVSFLFSLLDIVLPSQIVWMRSKELSQQESRTCFCRCVLN